MANPVDVVIKKEALDSVRELNALIKQSQAEVLKLGSDFLNASKNISNINTPSALSANGRNNANYSANAQAQAQQLNVLTNAKQRLNKQTTEEIVNNGILNRNARQAVLSNSQLAGSYANLSAQVNIASKKYQDLIVRGRLVTQTQAQYNKELRTAKIEFQSLNFRVLQADKAVGKWGRTGERSLGIMKNLVGAFGLAGGVTLFASVTRDIFNQTKELQSLDLALSQVLGNQDKFVESQIFLSRVSESYGISIKELTKSYTQFYVSAKDKLEDADIQGIFESVSKAAGAMGLSIDQQQGAFLALTQMLSKGNIQAEELRGQLSERLPGAFGIMAKSMGVTEAQLNKMLKDGKVLAAEVLPKFAKELEKAYGIENLNRVTSLNAETTRLSNSWTNLIREFSDGESGVSKFFAILISGAAEITKSLTDLMKSRDKLLGESGATSEQRGLSDALKSIKDNASESQQSMEDWAKSLKRVAEKDVAYFSQKVGETNTLMKFHGTTMRQWFSPDSYIKLQKYNKELTQYSDALAYAKGQLKGVDEILNPKQKKATPLEETAEEINKRLQLEENRAKQQYVNRKKELELELQVIDTTLNNDEKFYQDRLTALELHRIKKIEILSLQYQEEMRLSNGNLGKQKEALLDYHSAILTEIERHGKQKEALEKLKPQAEGVVELSNSQKELSDSAKEAGKSLELQNQITEDGEARMKRLKEATDAFLSSFSDSFLSEAGLGSFQKFFDGTFNQLMAGAETMEDKFKVAFLAISEAAQEAFNFINEASEANFDAEYARLEKQKEIAIMFAGESTTAQEEIQRQYEERKKAIQRREAEAQKRLAVFNILIDTAQAVVSALPNIPLSIAVGVIGALQAGFVASQPIPQFFEGGTHKGGLMLVNDAKGNNYRETIVTPDGKIIQPTQRNVLMNAPSGTEIYTPEQWHEKQLNDMLMANGIGYKPTINSTFATSNQSNGLTKDQFDAGINKLSKSIKNAPSSQVLFDELGYRKFQTVNGQRKQRLNNRFNINGK